MQWINFQVHGGMDGNHGLILQSWKFGNLGGTPGPMSGPGFDAPGYHKSLQVPKPTRQTAALDKHVSVKPQTVQRKLVYTHVCLALNTF